MAKKQNFLIILLLILLVLALYLILTSESVRQAADKAQPERNQAAANLEADYEAKVKPIFTAYEKLVGENNFTADKITELKNQLLDLRVPTKYKELHINLVLALTKMENYLNQKEVEEKIASLKMADQLKADYSWLNN